MRKRMLIVLLLACPVGGTAVSALLIWRAESLWQSELATAYPDTDPANRAELTLARACSVPDVASSMPDFCTLRSYDTLLGVVSVGSGALALAWLAVIYGAGRLAIRSRRLLLHFFVPGLHLTNILVALLILASAGIVISSVPLLMNTFGGRWPVKIFLVLLLVGVGAVAGVIAVLKASFSVVQTTTASVLGKPVQESDVPALWATVREVARDCGAQPPDNVVVGLEPNFFVTEAPVRATAGELRGRTMFISLPLCRILRLAEVRAVLGHEMAHFVGLDTRFSRQFFPVYRGTAVALRGLAEAGGDGAQALALMPAVGLLSYFFDSFEEAEKKISREREFVADEGGARITSREAMATALVKVHAFSAAWAGAREAMAEALQQGRMYKNASALFGDIVASNAVPERLEGLDERRLAHPTDSHPPLAVRLAHLETTIAAVQAEALDVSLESAAISVIENFVELESALSEVEQVVLARELRIDLSEGLTGPVASTG